MSAAKRLKLFAAANDGEEEVDGEWGPAPSANADASSERASPQERRFRGQRVETPSRPGARGRPFLKKLSVLLVGGSPSGAPAGL